MKLTTRHLIHGAGRHRATPTDRITVPLDDLLGEDWPQPQPVNPMYVQCWDDCPNCRVATAGVLDVTGWTCGQCLTTTPAKTGGAR